MGTLCIVHDTDEDAATILLSVGDMGRRAAHCLNLLQGVVNTDNKKELS